MMVQPNPWSGLLRRLPRHAGPAHRSGSCSLAALFKYDDGLAPDDVEGPHVRLLDLTSVRITSCHAEASMQRPDPEPFQGQPYMMLRRALGLIGSRSELHSTDFCRRRIGSSAREVTVRQPPRKTHRSEHNSGFALVIVIWFIGLLGLLFSTYIAAARYRAIEASSLAQRAYAEAAAEAGVNIAVFDLLSHLASGADLSTRFEPDGAPVQCLLDNQSVLTIAMSNEGGKVDLNTAEPELLQALFFGIKEIDSSAQRSLLKGIIDRRSASRPMEGQDAQNPVPAFRSIWDLYRLPGVDSGLMRRLEPIITVHSRSPGINSRVASARTLRTLSVPSSGSDVQLPSFVLADTPSLMYTVRVDARHRSGARFSRAAVVEFSKDPVGYAIREWREGFPISDDGGATGVKSGPC
jgi:general secretion pathway protein K